MTCDTSMHANLGVSFALSEAENIWLPILKDAIRGELQPVYGGDQRWAARVEAPVLIPPSRRDLRRYVNPMLGIYPARGCPFSCNFCSVIKIAGRQIRSQPVATTIESLRAAKAAGVKVVMFTSDNFNKYPDAMELLQAIVDAGWIKPDETAARNTAMWYLATDIYGAVTRDWNSDARNAFMFHLGEKFGGVLAFRTATEEELKSLHLIGADDTPLKVASVSDMQAFRWANAAKGLPKPYNVL